MNLQSVIADRVVDWATDVDLDACAREVAALRAKHPDLPPREAGRRLLRRYQRWAAGGGALTAMASGPVVAGPAAVLEAGAIMWVAARMHACLGLLADPDFADDPDRRAFIKHAVGTTRLATGGIRRTAIGGATRLAARFAVGRAAVRLVPLAGGIVGGIWTWVEVQRLGQRYLDHFFPTETAMVTTVAAPPVPSEEAPGTGRPHLADPPEVEPERVSTPAERRRTRARRSRDVEGGES
jgi:hypothetical protein